MVDWLLYEHDDGRHAVAPSAEAATFSRDDPAWHRVGLVQVPDGLSLALQIVEAEDKARAYRDALEEILSIEPTSPEGGHEAVAEIHQVARSALGMVLPHGGRDA